MAATEKCRGFFRILPYLPNTWDSLDGHNQTDGKAMPSNGGEKS